MKIRFTIHYVTQWGQTISVFILSDQNKNPQQFLMTCNKDFEWSTEIEFKTPLKFIQYRYGLLHPIQKLNMNMENTDI